MTPFGFNLIEPRAEGVLQFIIAGAPLLVVFFLRMVLGRSKEVALASWIGLAWFAFRASMNPTMASIFRPIGRLLVG